MPIERDQAASVLEAMVSLIRVTRTVAHRDSAHSVTATPIALLKLVSQTDPRLGDLAEQLHVKPSVASRAVAALEVEGYVSRITDPADARACRVRITEPGRRYLKSREDWALEMVSHTLSDWSPEEADMSVRVMQRLEQSIDEWAGQFPRATSDSRDPITGSVTALGVPTDDEPAQAPPEVGNPPTTTQVSDTPDQPRWEKTAV